MENRSARRFAAIIPSSALAAGLAVPTHAATIDLVLQGLTGGAQSSTGEVDYGLAGLNETAAVLSEGSPLTFPSPGMFEGFLGDGSLDEATYLRDLSVTIGGTTLSSSISQTVTARSPNICGDGCTRPSDNRYFTFVTFEDPDPVEFVFDGIGILTVDVSGLELSDSSEVARGDIGSSGNGDVVVSFAAFDDPEPMSPVPVPASLPLLLAGLGLAGIVKSRAGRRKS